MSRRSIISNRQGAAAIIVLQMFIVSMFFAFLAINLSNVQRQHAAGQISSDLASRWGVDMISRSENQKEMAKQIEEVALKNWTVNDTLTKGWLEKNRDNIDVNIEFGSAKVKGDSLVFKSGQKPTNAVRVSSHMATNVVGYNSRTVKELNIARAATSVAIERDLCLVVDRSGSMNFDLHTGTWSTDKSRHWYNPMSTSNSSYWRSRAHIWWWYWPHPTDSRWSTMLPAVHGLAAELDKTSQHELFSIVSYSTQVNGYAYTHGWGGKTKKYTADPADIESDPTFDYHQATEDLEERYTWDQPVMGGTNISAGIDLAAQVLTGSNARPNAFKTMIVMTDGQFNDGRDPWQAAADAAALGIEVYTVTFSHQANQQTMIEAAKHGGGKHFHAPDGKSLEEIFRAIANIPPAAFIE